MNTAVIRPNINPTVPGTGPGTGGVAPAKTGIPGGSPPPLNPAGLTPRSPSGVAAQRQRTATVPTSLARPEKSPMGPRPLPAKPASMSQASAPQRPLAGGTPGLAFGQRPAATPAGARPMPTAEPPTATVTAGPAATATARPQATAFGGSAAPSTPPAVPPHTSSLADKPTAQQTPPAVPPHTSSLAGETPIAQPMRPPVPPHTSSLPDQAPAARPTPAAEGSAGQLADVAMALGNTGVAQAGTAMATSTDQMSQVMQMNMEMQTRTALMKLIVDMNNALAKQIKEAGKSVSQLAG